MTKFKNIFAVLFMFLQALSIFAAEQKYAVNVGVARVLVPSTISPEDEPLYKRSAVFSVSDLSEIRKMFKGNEYQYFVQKSELLFGEEISPQDIYANYYWIQVPGSKISGLIHKKNLVEKNIYFYFDLVTVEPLVNLKIGDKEENITISMGTKLHALNEGKKEEFESLSNAISYMDEQYILRLDEKNCGWIRKKNACKLGDLRALPTEQKRTNIIEQARKLLGQPYQWGGRAALEGHGYDCSALVQIAYLTGAGIDLPRADFEQANYGKEINPNDLASGDLLFTLWHSPMRNKNIMIIPIHVMIWVGGNMLIEASPISMTVRETSVQEAFFGLSFHDIKDGQLLHADDGKTYSVQFRRFL